MRGIWLGLGFAGFLWGVGFGWLTDNGALIILGGFLALLLTLWGGLTGPSEQTYTYDRDDERLGL